jgi:hypothetical protein
MRHRRKPTNGRALGVRRASSMPYGDGPAVPGQAIAPTPQNVSHYTTADNIVR